MIAIEDKDFRKLIEFIKNNYGINLIQKRTLIESRLTNFLTERGLNSFSKYLEIVFKDNSGLEVNELINRLTTNLTYFMREPQHFEYFSRTILPWLEKTSQGRDLRIWSAGCSTGEEAYTLAMVLYEFFEKRKSLWDTRILATDISQKALDTAAKGVYSCEMVEKLPPLWRMKYFNSLENNSYEICPEIKKEVIFAPFNLMEEVFPFKKKFHVIFCRNVMIYFDKTTKDSLVKKFYEATECGGYFFIGHSESLEKNGMGYKYILPSAYRKI